MKTELQIAKQNVKILEWLKRNEDTKGYIWEDGEYIDERTGNWICKKHKQTCQRFLDWFKDETNYLWTISSKEICELKENKVNKQITDLKNTIKHYERNGI